MKLKLMVDGNEIPLNDFVEKMWTGTVAGGVSSLKGITEEWKIIEIKISR